ncbi:hypothetical protein ILUMI_03871 [Ignelater luminosus]|uniref:Uncharacterized protein n=1 Tax=Ignelater luminosus TaxID=2038154 RepID=A0A8K0DFS5_IGNLU|nr:hypothetical protein ILUMI_03871 [Ignelater luminosus]
MREELAEAKTKIERLDKERREKNIVVFGKWKRCQDRIQQSYPRRCGTEMEQSTWKVRKSSVKKPKEYTKVGKKKTDKAM